MMRYVVELRMVGLSYIRSSSSYVRSCMVELSLSYVRSCMVELSLSYVRSCMVELSLCS